LPGTQALRVAVAEAQREGEEEEVVEPEEQREGDTLAVVVKVRPAW
jgi:hypothetical protein